MNLRVIRKDKNTYRAIIQIDYDRDEVLKTMEEEDIKGQGYIGKFYEYDIKERIEDDVRSLLCSELWVLEDLGVRK